MKVTLIPPFLSLALTLVVACSSNEGVNPPTLLQYPSATAVVWDEDTREDATFEDPDNSLVQSTAVFINHSRLQRQEDGTFRGLPIHLRSRYQLCEDEKFQDQTLLGHCSGVLIGPRILLTAGHCVPEQKYCDESAIIFGYTQAKALAGQYRPEEVYSCKRIIKAFNNAIRDYAIIELDRDVTQSAPVKLGQGSSLQQGEKVLSLSYPLGLPLKKDQGQVFQNSIGGVYLRAKVDTFAGSSGSPLFNSQKELVGILVSGADDFDEDELYRVRKDGGCIKAKRCTDSTCFGERYLKLEGVDFN